MGRPSKLSPQQWDDVIRRVAEGEAPADLAREYDVHPSQITRRVSQVSQSVRKAAEKMAEAQVAVAALAPTQQYQAMSLADKLRSTYASLASAAELGAKTSHRLMALANEQVAKVDDADPMGEESVASLKNAAALTKMGNDSATIAFSLMSSTKDTVKRLTEEGGEEEADVLTPERVADGARRIAFTLARAAQATENT